MKSIIINLLMTIALFTVSIDAAYSQGCFEIENISDCSWDYIIYGNNINCNGTSVVVDQGTISGMGGIVYINSTYCQSLSLMMERIEIYENNTLVAAFGNKSSCGYPDSDTWSCISCSCSTNRGEWDSSNNKVLIQ